VSGCQGKALKNSSKRIRQENNLYAEVCTATPAQLKRGTHWATGNRYDIHLLYSILYSAV
jgi:hypothetical protein